jgi:phosphonate transport system substrate-binding protein
MFSTNRRRGAAGSLVIVVLSLVIAAAAIGGIIYMLTIRMPSQQQMAEVERAMLSTSGLGTPVKNKLDAKFVDANGDGIADPPADASQLLDPPTLAFSYIATEDPGQFKDTFKDLIAALSKATGRPVEYVSFTATEDELKAMADGKLHIVGLSTGSVPIAVDACGFVPVCSLGDSKGKAMSQMEIIVPADSTIQSVQDLKGKELTLTEPGSNSGYKAPLVLLKNDFGMLPGRDYGIVYSGGQDKSVAGIASKQYKAAAVASDVLQRDVASGLIKQGDFRSIYKSGSFPTAGLGYVYNLKPELADKIKDAMVKFDWSGTNLEKQFAATGQNKFTPVNYRDDWALVRKIDDEIGYVHQVK